MNISGSQGGSLSHTQAFNKTTHIGQQTIINLTQTSPIVEQSHNTNNSIDNLSTLRSSDINERERNLLAKIKHYKNENQQLIILLKESEQKVAEKVAKQKRETDQILMILNKLWPFMQKVMQLESKLVDAQTKEVLMALGNILGKDTSIVEQAFLNAQHNQNVSQLNMSEMNVLKRENEFLRLDLGKTKRENEQTKQLVSFYNLKCDLLLREVDKEYIALNYQQEALLKSWLPFTTPGHSASQQQHHEIVPSIAKLGLLEYQIQDQIQAEDSQINQLRQKLASFEKEISRGSSFFGGSDYSNKSSTISPRKVPDFDTEITLLNNNGYLIKSSPGTDQQSVSPGLQGIRALQQQQKQPSSPFNMTPGPISGAQVSQISATQVTQRKNQVSNNYQQQPIGENTNVSLPDISSTEVAPNKLNAPSKIININHVRGLQFYQKQLGKNGDSNAQQLLEELGMTVLDQSGVNNKIYVKNNLALLRNRSTSPTIIQKKSLVRKDP